MRSVLIAAAAVAALRRDDDRSHRRQCGGVRARRARRRLRRTGRRGRRAETGRRLPHGDGERRAGTSLRLIAAV